MRNFLLTVCVLLLSPIQVDGQIANRYDIVIDELLPDPTPQVGLPTSEFAELKNVSGTAFNLAGWQLSDGTSTATLPSFVLQPDSFVIICATSAAPSFATIGATLGVSNFPSLNNDADLIFLRSPQNTIIHAVNYTADWYQNELKKDGGWTLEMIDTKNPCGGFTNWKASVDVNGGTPGNKNSVASTNTDRAGPLLLNGFSTDSINITLVFNEPLDSLKGATAANYIVSDGVGTPLSAITFGPIFNKVHLQLNTPLQLYKVYTITAANISDCAGNNISQNNSTRFGLPSAADSFDVVINEILFNPRPDGVDYIEIYNRSQKIIDLKQLYIANRNSSGVISSIVRFNTENRLFFPGDFIVLTENIDIVQHQYITNNPPGFIPIASLPSFSDDKGDVIILNAQGTIVDEVKYQDKWHFKLIPNTEGVALERIDYNSPSIENNFHSAATSVGYGTPGYKNSQYRTDQQVKGEININPEIFSPDNDGIDDFLTIDYSFPSPGYVANITIFDVSGRPVRYLQRNALSGIKGSYRWDGLGEKKQKLQQGIYIVFTEIFNTEGNKKQFKNTVVLARR
jgi:Lamin Tail Domain/CHU_C Type IX secretion signal domain/Bacterial Ig-like domain